jgi:hypothetical protein
MLHDSYKNRSPLCRVITDFHSPNEKRMARFDPWGVAISATLAAILVECVRFIVSR